MGVAVQRERIGWRTSTENPRPWVEEGERVARALGRPFPVPGPWDDEPDDCQWTDGRTGWPCWVKRGSFGSWCGYVCVPRDHPWHGKTDDEVEAMDDLLRVHGGLTFIGSWLQEGDWWFGFDCGHAWDVMPGMPNGWGTVPKLTPGLDEVYRTLPYVLAEVDRLADQLFVVKAAVAIISMPDHLGGREPDG